MPGWNVPSIDPSTDENKILLEQLQANILKYHGRDHVNHIFLHFQPGSIRAVKRWIASLPVTSALKQHNDSKERAERGKDGGPVVCFYLTYEGYKALGYGAEHGQKIEFLEGGTAFTEGMRPRGVNELMDREDQTDWEPFFQGEVHAMLLIADDDPNRITETTNQIIPAQTIPTLFEAMHSEPGIKLKSNDLVTEPFGFADGINSPVFLKEAALPGGIPENQPHGYTLDKVLAQYRIPVYNNANNTGYGSFMVFRKLQQNKANFEIVKEAVARAADPAFNSLSTAEKDARIEEAGVQIIGRKKDGTPLLDNPPLDKNSFDFNSDPNGLKCPFSAHIRKVNPRTPQALDMAIVRRGIPYQKKNEQGIPEREGMLFMCFQRDIGLQFEAMQKAANDPGNGGMDRLIGQPNTNDITTLKGGAYFHAPGIPLLKSMNMYNFFNPAIWGDPGNEALLGAALNYYNTAYAYIDSYALAAMGSGGPTKPPPPPPPPMEKMALGAAGASFDPNNKTLRHLKFSVPVVRIPETDSLPEITNFKVSAKLASLGGLTLATSNEARVVFGNGKVADYALLQLTPSAINSVIADEFVKLIISIEGVDAVDDEKQIYARQDLLMMPLLL